MSEITLSLTQVGHRDLKVLLAARAFAKTVRRHLMVRTTDPGRSPEAVVLGVRVHPRYGDLQFRIEGGWYNITGAPWQFFLR